MKRNKLNTLAITTLLTGSLLAGGNALAGDKEHWGRDGGHHGQGMHEGMKRGGHMKHIMRAMHDLDLTAEQKKAMIDIGEKYKGDFQAAHQQMRDARMALREVMHTGDYGSSDEVAAATEPAAETQAQAMKKMIILRAQVQAEAHSLLTPDQREQLDQRRAKMKEHHQKKWAKRQEG